MTAGEQGDAQKPARPHPPRWPWPDFAALFLALLGFALSLWVATRYFERIPHIEDEMAFTWQARVIAESGKITTPTPVCPKCFLVPFVVDYQGQRFGKYPLGWPAALAIGEKLGTRELVNPLLAGFSVWLVYLLGRRLFNRPVGLLAAFLTCTSPFFLMNAGSLLSHGWSLFLTLGFTLAWLDLFGAETRIPRGVSLLTAAMCMGMLALTRPLTALGVALPFGLHGAVLLARGPRMVRLRLVGFVLLAGLIASLYLLWQYAVTGDAFLNPYLLWWPYDKVGFGPGVGINPAGHTLAKAWFHTRFSLWVGSHDLFGWPYLSYIMLPFGLWAGRRRLGVWLAAGTALGLVGIYLLYWTPAWIYGPRYYFEGLPAAALLSAAGLAWLGGTFGGRWSRWRRWVVWTLAGLLVAGNLLFYLPQRIGMMYGLYDVRAADLAPFRSAEAKSMPPTLVIVYITNYWVEYGRLLDLSSPLHTSQFIFTIDRGTAMNQQVINAFPERQVWEYHPALDVPLSLEEDQE